jgi:hypothetical protein
MSDACEAPDRTVSISAVAEALLALEDEIKQLQIDAERHYIKMTLAMQKMAICREAIDKTLLAAAGGVRPRCPTGHWPELHSID